MTELTKDGIDARRRIVEQCTYLAKAAASLSIVEILLAVKRSMDDKSILIHGKHSYHNDIAAYREGFRSGLYSAYGDKKIFEIVETSYLRTGAFWETLMACKQYKSDNVRLIIDFHESQLPLHRTSLEKIVMYAGWAVTCVDGHNIQHIVDAFDWADTLSLPALVIASTVYGRGVHFLADAEPIHRHATPDEIQLALSDLNEAR